MYSLLQHTNAVQIRFFSQVLSQMASKMQSNAGLSPTSPASSARPKSTGGQSPIQPPRVSISAASPNPSGLLPHSPNSVYDPFGAPNSPLLRPLTPGESAISSADWSMGGLQLSVTPSRSRSPSYSSAAAAGLSRSRSPSYVSDAFAEKWEVNLKPPASPGTPGTVYTSDNGSEGGSEGRVEKGAIPDTVDFAILEDIPAWLRSLRLVSIV
jgi:hypothetical protein